MALFTAGAEEEPRLARAARLRPATARRPGWEPAWTRPRIADTGPVV